MRWEVRPQAMIGHSVGEFVAACLAGVFSPEDALAIVATRARLMQQLPPGAMLSVRLGEDEAKPLLNGELSLAAANGPRLSVVAGPVAAIQAFERKMTERGVPARRLATSHAFHSRMMDPIIEPFTDYLRRFRFNAPTMPYVSGVSGTWVTAEEATDPAYWARHFREPVRFSQGVRLLHDLPERLFLEVGPGPSSARSHASTTSARPIRPPSPRCRMRPANRPNGWRCSTPPACYGCMARPWTGPRCTAQGRGVARCPPIRLNVSATGSTHLSPEQAPRSVRLTSAPTPAEALKARSQPEMTMPEPKPVADAPARTARFARPSSTSSRSFPG